ncbi:MAG TPA: flagellar filament capping protein FliD [Bacillota bacterium]|nr:flagellar filament capping protein FliD [Bacillota bacterium]
MSIRIGGLASGMDIDQIVNDLMRAERIRVDKVLQDKTLAEWTRDAYNDVNKMLAEFVLDTRQAFGLTSTSTGSIMSRPVSSLTWVKGATVTDTNIVAASAGANTPNGSYSLNVHNLAQNWSSASFEPISGDNDRSDIGSQFNLNENDIVDFRITTGQGENDQQSIRVYIDENEAYISVTDADGIENISELEGQDLSNVSLSSIATQINNAKIGATAIYDSATDRFFLQTSDTGHNKTITVDDNSVLHDELGNVNTDQGFIDKLRLRHADGETMQDLSLGTTYRGIDAKIDFGAATNITMSTNRITINNIDLTIKALGKATVNVDTDEEAVIEKITGFVNSYNEMIDGINGVVTQDRYRDFPPLTADQKEGMTEKEIEIWEERAKSGLLRNDSIISRVSQRARTGIYQNVEGLEGAFAHLVAIGITTESYSAGSMGGRLQIDESKLREALRTDVDGVMNLLFKEPDSSITDVNEKRANTGLIARVYSDIAAGMKEIINKAGPGSDRQLYRNVDSTMLLDFVTKNSSISMLDSSITSYERRIGDLEARLARKEEAYWRQFTAMEQALNQMYSQSEWLYQQLGM